MTLQQKMILSGVISVLAAIALGRIGYWGQTQMATALAHNQLSLQAMRNHLEGDMMHDGLRADVLNAFVIDSSDSAAVSQLRSDLREHSEWFQRSLEANAKLPLGPEVSAAIAASRRRVEAVMTAIRADARENATYSATGDIPLAARLAAFGQDFHA